VGALWLWSAAAYHALLFTRINPAAWVFAALGVVGGSAAMLLTVRSDYVLPGAGALRTGVLATAWFRTPGRY
jgi:hypothetical protein